MATLNGATGHGVLARLPAWAQAEGALTIGCDLAAEVLLTRRAAVLEQARRECARAVAGSTTAMQAATGDGAAAAPLPR